MSVYKGYNVHETFNVAGVATVYDENYDYNSNASANVTVDDHTIQNDNNNQENIDNFVKGFAHLFFWQTHCILLRG